MKIFNESGKGYWMEGVGCLRAEGENRPSRHGHIVILNDQGGRVMDVSEEVTATLRAQDHGHPPVICFEPVIMGRDCSAGNRAYVDVCSTLRAQMGDNQPAVCFQQNQREEVRDMGEQAGALTSESGMHNTNYVLYEVKNEQRKLPESVGSAKQTAVRD